MIHNIDLDTRHPSVKEVAQFFAYDHLPQDLAIVSASCWKLAMEALDHLPDSPELTVGLRKLLEAKDCFVRAAVAARED